MNIVYFSGTNYGICLVEHKGIVQYSTPEKGKELGERITVMKDTLNTADVHNMTIFFLNAISIGPKFKADADNDLSLI